MWRKIPFLIFGIVGILEIVGILTLPLQAGEPENPGNYQVVDLVAPLSNRRSDCPESSPGRWEGGGGCSMSGIVERVRIEPSTDHSVSRMILLIGGDPFVYILRSANPSEIQAPISLFAASRFNRTPLTIRFFNWGGTFYITDISL